MDLVSYSDYAVRLVNTADSARPDRDALADMAALRNFLADAPAQRARATRRDLVARRLLRDRLVRISEAVDAGHPRDAVHRLNALLVEHPIRPQISGHDDEDWHLHLTERGDVAARYAAKGGEGLSVLLLSGVSPLGVCAASAAGACLRQPRPPVSSLGRSAARHSNVAAYRAERISAEPNTVDRYVIMYRHSSRCHSESTRPILTRASTDRTADCRRWRAIVALQHPSRLVRPRRASR